MPAKLTGDLTKRMKRGEKRTATAVRQTEKAIAKGAQKRAPRDTNHLADESIRVEEINDHQGVVIVQTADATHPEYGYLVERGTRHMAAQPFFIPAVEVEREPFRRRISKAYEA